MGDSESLSEAAASGDRRRGLQALRGRLVAALEECEPREVAALSRQLALVLKELDELPAAKGASSFDDLASRRAARKSAASGQ